ncbi:MAG: sugar transferase [Chloroflexi bacterium]|nr:sugar transferase [Chloroflexota bacterium]
MRNTVSETTIGRATECLFYEGSTHRNKLMWTGYVALKRAMDLLFAIGGIVVFAPLMLLVAVLVWLDSGGPVIFKQERVGQNGRRISILKFRTMHNGAPKYSSKVARHDPHITRLGRFLRRSSIDELPQLINVVRGDMSLVGPRPEQPWIVEQVYQPWQFRRLLAPPGLTGWWQVNGRSDRPMHENTELDLFYVDHQSLWLDAIILFKTIGVVLSGKGAR